MENAVHHEIRKTYRYIDKQYKNLKINSIKCLNQYPCNRQSRIRGGGCTCPELRRLLSTQSVQYNTKTCV